MTAQLVRFLTLASLAAPAALAACAAAEDVRETQRQEPLSAQSKAEANMDDEALPVNRRFRDLDAYLLYLRNVSAPSDGPWYREVGPGLYKLETGNRRRLVELGETNREEEQTFTRQQLLEKFGFSN